MSEDIALLKAIAQKDMLAMEQFYRRYENSVFRFAIKKLNNEFDAADIVNTVMLEVWNTADRFEGRSKISTWLLGIANFRIIDLLRKRKSNHDDIDEVAHAEALESDDDMERLVSVVQNQKFIGRCLSKLSGDHKQILELLFFNELAYDDISDVLQCTLGTVKSRLFHAKRLLKKCLEKYISQ